MPARAMALSVSPVGGVYGHPSPSHSSDSLSDDGDDDVNKSTFFQPQSPAQWLYPRRPSLSVHSSPIERLPAEIIIHVLRYLHAPRDLYRSMLVCRTWCECSVELLWHKPTFANLATLNKMTRILTQDDAAFIYADFVRRLNFLFCGPDLSDAVFARVARCSRLERLTLVSCRTLSEQALVAAFKCFPSLVAVDLTSVGETTDHVIAALAATSRRLQGINLGGCKRVTDRGVLALARGCPLLRRVKLAGLELLTDEAIGALATGCPLLLEIDLNGCELVTERSVREIWTHSTHMREMRLSHCEELADSAFPAPVRTDLPAIIPPNGAANPFAAPSQPIQQLMFPHDSLPPLRPPKRFDHLRMLDLTSCSLVTDDAVEGIIAHAPKIRNLVLAKCQQLTDRSVDNICKLGKHLHYLHLGHCSSITDISVKNLARSCTRLRYIDLANCTLLTDMAVFELSSLPKLRRVGLVRVNNLTDESIYSLGERHATLERIHLSYCNRITIVAINFLLQKLPKLTHLSLTGIPAFRRPELQRFCRQPPQDFNSSQRSAFCVFSGKGVSELRDYLHSLFEKLHQDTHGDAATEYESDHYVEQYLDDTEGGEGYEVDDGDPDAEAVEEDGDRDFAMGEVAAPLPVPAVHGTPQAAYHRTLTHSLYNPGDPTVSAPAPIGSGRPAAAPLRSAGTPGTPITPPNEPPPPIPAPITLARRGGFGEHPLIEAPASPPPPSDAGSVRSAGTNGSGAAFYRTYQQHGATSPTGRSQDGGALTPDLVFAEIGHGRGVAHAVSGHLFAHQQAMAVGGPSGVNGHSAPAMYPSSTSLHPPTGHNGSAQVMPGGVGHAMGSFAHHNPVNARGPSESPHSIYYASAARQTLPAFRPPGQSTSSLSLQPSHPASSSTSLALVMNDPQHLDREGEGVHADDRSIDGRGKTGRWSLKGTLNAATHSLFGRPPGEGSRPGSFTPPETGPWDH